jgi:undecaprenyl phosphate N,N'-diacetylbacillosamine 1-phosphate transferase
LSPWSGIFDVGLLYTFTQACQLDLGRGLWYKGRMRVQRFLKYILDVVGALAGLAVMAVPFLCIGVWIKLDSKGPVFFRQERVGKNEKPFRIYKFRTMIEGAEHMGGGVEIQQNDSRITRIGKWLRRFGIDELPQFFNILRGEMSLVGPRPGLPHQVAQYTNFEKQRLRVKPGIASMDMIKGAHKLSWKERIQLDVWYLDHWSLGLDIKILIGTFFVVFSEQWNYNAAGRTQDYKQIISDDIE